MKIYLREDVKANLLIRPEGGGGSFVTLDISKGRYLDAMEFSNLPSHITEKLDRYTIKEIKDYKTFVIYLKRQYWAVQACYVDKAKF